MLVKNEFGKDVAGSGRGLTWVYPIVYLKGMSHDNLPVIIM